MFESFLQSLGQAKIKEIKKLLLHTGNLAPRKLSKYDLTAYHGTYCQEEKAPAFSSCWWQLIVIFNIITDSSVNLTKFRMKVDN